MIKRIILSLLLISSVYAKSYNGQGQSLDKNVAKQEAHWSAFESALEDLLDGEGVEGKIFTSFRNDFEKDYLTFRRKYFKSSNYECRNLEDEFVCRVKSSNINLRKVTKYIKKKSNSTTTMGRNRMSKLDIVLIDNVSNSYSKDFITNLHKAVNDSGHSLDVLSKGTPVGKSGNKCEELKRQKKVFKRKGKSYLSALRGVERRLKQCEENIDVKYAFSLDKLEIDVIRKTSDNRVMGSLNYRIFMLNSQSGKREDSIESLLIKAIGSTKKDLDFILYKDASKEITRQITNNILSNISSSSEDKKISKFDKYEYMYTVKLVGLTNDRTDRSRIKIVKDSVKKYGSKLKKNRSEGDDFNQVYNFGSNTEIDLEELMYELYDIADSAGLQIKITDESDDILSVQFQ